VLRRLRERGVRVRVLRRDPRSLAAARVVYLCIPEDEITRVAGDLAKAWRDGPRPSAVLHAAGHLGSRALAPLGALGIAVGVLHPLRAFSLRGANASVRTRQACWTSAGDARAHAAARWLVRRLDPRARVWATRDDAASRRLYHAGCVLANNGGLALHQLAAELLVGAGLSALAADLGAAALLDSSVFRGPAERVIEGRQQLRGPLARGQLQVVREHLQAMGAKSLAGRAYRALSLELLELARGGQRLDPQQLREFERLLR
jgi:predicted short-subunit dehydrogenase-like oxidoreductase (DUF2520 family)